MQEELHKWLAILKKLEKELINLMLLVTALLLSERDSLLDLLHLSPSPSMEPISPELLTP